jgi:hypothetical protein
MYNGGAKIGVWIKKSSLFLELGDRKACRSSRLSAMQGLRARCGRGKERGRPGVLTSCKDEQRRGGDGLTLGSSGGGEYLSV